MRRNETGEIIGDEDRIIIFATVDGLIDMLGHRHWAGDATFDSCPGLFYQLLTMHCSVGKNYMPTLFCLMPDKSHLFSKKYVVKEPRSSRIQTFLSHILDMVETSINLPSPSIISDGLKKNLLTTSP